MHRCNFRSPSISFTINGLSDPVKFRYAADVLEEDNSVLVPHPLVDRSIELWLTLVEGGKAIEYSLWRNQKISAHIIKKKIKTFIKK